MRTRAFGTFVFLLKYRSGCVIAGLVGDKPLEARPVESKNQLRPAMRCFDVLLILHTSAIYSDTIFGVFVIWVCGEAYYGAALLET